MLDFQLRTQKALQKIPENLESEVQKEGINLKQNFSSLSSHDRTVLSVKTILNSGKYNESQMELMLLQQNLVNLGYDLGKSGKYKNGIDGLNGPLTKKSIELFQNEHQTLDLKNKSSNKYRECLLNCVNV